MKYSTQLMLALTALLITGCGIKTQVVRPMKETENHTAWSRNAVIYEVNVRQYTPEGTFNAFAAHLPRLKEMGVDILWLMPVHPVGEKNRKGSLGSYYAVKDYKGVNPEFGTLHDLKQLVEQAHLLGMKVIFDWVANHTAWDHVWTKTNPEYFERGEDGDFVSPYDWTDVIELDYNQRAMRDSMIDALKYWVTEVGIDGYRCDVAGMVPTDFWDDAREELERVKPVFMLAEDEDNPDLLRSAFDMNYAWKIHHLMNRIVEKTSPASEFWSHYQWNDSIFKRSMYRMNFITNHDENSWNGTEYERMGEGVEAFAVLSFMIPGMPLIYSGQEAGLDKRLRFFEKDTIVWGPVVHHQFYKKLIQIKKVHVPLWNGEFGSPMIPLKHNHEAQVIAFARSNGNETVMAIFNMSDKQLDAVNIKSGEYAGSYTDAMSGETMKFGDDITMSLRPWSYKVLVKKSL
jgi:glycosidase